MVDKTRLNNTYVFAARKDEDRSLVKVIKGPLRGAVIKIHTIKFGEEENSDGTMDLKINHDFVEKPETEATKSIVDEVIGTIVVDILQNYMMEEGFGDSFEIAR